MSDNIPNYNSKEDSQQVPARLTEVPADISQALVTIQHDIQSIVAHKHASPEFRALMDGYVSKANEAEFEKVRARSIEEKFEEVRSEFRSLKETSKKLQSDLDATRDALKASESDLHRTRQDFVYYKDSAESKIQDLNEDKRSINQKLRDLLADKEKTSAEFQNVQARLLEANHRYKQLEQDKGIDQDNYDRVLRESEHMVLDLREQLDLRTRELEYKDALLNQLIRQASEPSIDYQAAINQAQNQPRAQVMQQRSNAVYSASAPNPTASATFRQELSNRSSASPFISQAKPLATKIVETSAPTTLAAAPAKSNAMRWGAVHRN